MDTNKKIIAVKEMKPAKLSLAWRKAHGTHALPGFSFTLSFRALAVHYQEIEHCTLTKAKLRQIGAIGRRDDRQSIGHEPRLCL